MSKAKKIILVITSVICLVFSSSIFALADNLPTIPFSSQRPIYDDHSGYAEFYVSNSSGAIIAFVVWCYRSESYKNMAITLNGSQVQFGGACYSLFMGTDGSSNYLPSNTNGHNYFDLRQWGSDTYVYGVHTYNLSVNFPSFTNHNFTFIYGADSLFNEKLNTIIGILSGSSGNIDKIISNDNKNSQAIIDNQNQLAEQEKTETQNSANNSVSDVSGSVPDKSAGMLSALQSLSNAVSYTGTSAKWTFPQMYIPAISGVTERINLNSSMEIDFTYWVNQIPQDIRTVISAIATIGLVIFAFKELYGLISYVLTLKGGGNNE